MTTIKAISTLIDRAVPKDKDAATRMFELYPELGEVFTSIRDAAAREDVATQDPEHEVLIHLLTNFQEQCHATAVSKGWWEITKAQTRAREAVVSVFGPDSDEVRAIDEAFERSIGQQIALMHSELSEALEGARHGNPPDDKVPQFTALEAEFADVIIRIFDTAGRLKLRVVPAMIAKAKFNTTRPHLHGGKRF